jgi:glycine/D-amino acid oxidase-like deaminating enzyme
MPGREYLQADVAVVGGGPAGIAAAVAAARSGLDTVLLEWHGFLGGSRTAAAVDTFYGFWTPGDARPLVGGIGLEIVERALRDGAFRRENTYGAGPGVTCDPELLKLQLDELVIGSGARLSYHSIVTGAERDEDGWRLDVATPTAGRREVGADYLIDASGDATAAALAGAPVFDAHREGVAQSLTTIFFLGGVDVERAMAVSHQERTALIAEADASGAYRLPRHEGSLHRTPHPGVLQANIVRIAGADATDPAALTEAEIEGRRQAYEYLRFFRDRLPGCERAFIVSLGHQIGIRETRRIVGRTVLTEEDVLAGRRGDDGIALCGAPIEDHRAGSDTRWASVGGDGVYSIPYGSLLPRELDRLIVAGRCLSAEHAAQASARNSAQAFATGEAAGYAIAAAAGNGGSPADVDVAALRARILDAGGLL